jgi:hypothetical protein
MGIFDEIQKQIIDNNQSVNIYLTDQDKRYLAALPESMRDFSKDALLTVRREKLLQTLAENNDALSTVPSIFEIRDLHDPISKLAGGATGLGNMKYPPAIFLNTAMPKDILSDTLWHESFHAQPHSDPERFWQDPYERATAYNRANAHAGNFVRGASPGNTEQYLAWALHNIGNRLHHRVDPFTYETGRAIDNAAKVSGKGYPDTSGSIWDEAAADYVGQNKGILDFNRNDWKWQTPNIKGKKRRYNQSLSGYELAQFKRYILEHMPSLWDRRIRSEDELLEDGG